MGREPNKIQELRDELQELMAEQMRGEHTNVRWTWPTSHATTRYSAETHPWSIGWFLL